MIVFLIRRRVKGMDLRRQRRALATTVLAATGMGAVLWAWLVVTRGQSIWVSGGVGILLGVAVYWVAALLLGVPDARELPGAVIRRRA